MLAALTAPASHAAPGEQAPPPVDRATASPPSILDDATLAREYASYRASLAGMSRYHVGYILVATEDEAKRLIARLRSGGDFATLARNESKHASAAQGGDLGAHAGCRWARDTVALLDALAPGQVHPHPVKASSGWGVYRLVAREPIEPRSLDRYRRELLDGRFEPECPWQPPVGVGTRPLR